MWVKVLKTVASIFQLLLNVLVDVSEKLCAYLVAGIVTSALSQGIDEYITDASIVLSQHAIVTVG